jgi:hypothetical protein
MRIRVLASPEIMAPSISPVQDQTSTKKKKKAVSNFRLIAQSAKKTALPKKVSSISFMTPKGKSETPSKPKRKKSVGSKMKTRKPQNMSITSLSQSLHKKN